VQIQSLKKQLAQHKEREVLLEQRAMELERERDCIQALWEAEKGRHGLAQKAMMSTLASAGTELSVRLNKKPS
jgi:hypothetical protein